MKYAAAFFIVLGLAIVGGAETQDWFPMFIVQIGLGVVTLITGGLFALHFANEEED